jgi:4-diphosphocytidyl-2-C-methyl-D-erythritol kinase
MIYFPNAKINLGLNITGKREDGFHELSSIFLPVGWCDVLEVHLSDAPGLDLKVLGLEIDGSVGDNLISKAYDLLSQDFTLTGIKASLKKAIPMGAGLGGGSADGAFMLKALNEMCKLGLSDGKLEEYAAELGSDCPFFIKNAPAMVEGRGEVITPVGVEFLACYNILIVHPGIHVNTGEAFRLIAGEFTEAITMEEAEQLKLKNDFEAKVAGAYPGIQEAINFVKSTEAEFVQMTGSGSAVFGLYMKDSVEGYKLKDEAEKKGYAAYFGALM